MTDAARCPTCGALQRWSYESGMTSGCLPAAAMMGDGGGPRDALRERVEREFLKADIRWGSAGSKGRAVSVAERLVREAHAEFARLHELFGCKRAEAAERLAAEEMAKFTDHKALCRSAEAEAAEKERDENMAVIKIERRRTADAERERDAARKALLEVRRLLREMKDHEDSRHDDCELCDRRDAEIRSAPETGGGE